MLTDLKCNGYKFEYSYYTNCHNAIKKKKAMLLKVLKNTPWNCKT